MYIWKDGEIMASYHTSFTYNGENSSKDKGLIVVAFEPDEGFTNSFLSMDNISDDYFDGTKKYNYGSRYSTSAEIQITLIKNNGYDLTLNEFRACAKWLTGSKIDTWLDMYVGDTIVYSFLGKFLNLEQYKLDGRTIGIRLTFSSVSPWAYSAPQVFSCSIWQKLSVTDDGIVIKSEENAESLGINNGVLYANYLDKNSYFSITSDGVAYLDNTYRTIIDNQSDDLYTYIYLDIDYINNNSTSLSINNATLGEESIITNMSVNEIISISAKQFIISDIPNKIFGDSFNFVWPRLEPGQNNIVISGDGNGLAKFTYRYPMKVGDCTMDISVYGGGCGDCIDIAPDNTVKWEDIINTPTTIDGYGITDAYTMVEVDKKIENIEVSSTGNIDIDKDELNNMLEHVLYQSHSSLPVTLPFYVCSSTICQE